MSLNLCSHIFYLFNLGTGRGLYEDNDDFDFYIFDLDGLRNKFIPAATASLRFFFGGGFATAGWKRTSPSGGSSAPALGRDSTLAPEFTPTGALEVQLF